MEIAPYEASHIIEIIPQDAQSEDWEALSDYDPDVLAGPLSWTFFDDDRIIACVGVTNGVGWAVFSEYIKPHHMFRIHRTARRVLDELRDQKVTDVRIFVDPHFKKAVKWAKLLGFSHALGRYTGDEILMERTMDGD